MRPIHAHVDRRLDHFKHCISENGEYTLVFGVARKRALVVELAHG